jgi:hypothetical protein
MENTTNTPAVNTRKNFFKDAEICHLWAHQLRDKAHKAGPNHYQLYFEGKTIYSYGSHFPIASIFGKANNFVAITTESYSNTTAGHIQEVKSALSHFAPENKIYCSDPEAAINGRHSNNLKTFETMAWAATKNLAKAKKPSIYFDQITYQKNLFDRYCAAFKIKTKKKDYPSLNIQPTPEDLAKIKKQAAAEKERKEKAEAAAEAKTMLQLNYWLQGLKYSDLDPERGDQLIPAPHGLKHTYLRIQGANVETSKGITIPTDTARRFYLWYIGTAAAGGCENCNKEILGYKVTQANAQGLVIGCHDITRTEIDKIATLLNW